MFFAQHKCAYVIVNILFPFYKFVNIPSGISGIVL
jgi:hypothetical protein